MPGQLTHLDTAVKSQNGFTLIELLVTISIIGLLGTLAAVGLKNGLERAKVVTTVAQVRELVKAVALFNHDTGQFPANCRLSCTPSTDPFVSALGVTGWNGPYFIGLAGFTHPWGGHIGTFNYDPDGDTIDEFTFVLDDDSPGPGTNDGLIPTSALLQIDDLLDDGNLGAGNVRGDGQGFGSAIGEIVIIIDQYFLN